MTKIHWTLSGTLDTDDAQFDPEDWLGRPAETPEDIRDAFLKAAHSGDGFDALRDSDVNGYSVHEIDDEHVHDPMEAWVVAGEQMWPRMCKTCGKKDPHGTMR